LLVDELSELGMLGVNPKESVKRGPARADWLIKR
jgi:hypothetical protein